MPGRTYLVYWCSEGLESIIDITEDLARANDFEREKIFEMIKDPDTLPKNQARKNITNLIEYMSMRGRANAHRDYELYCLHTVEEITKECLEGFFDTNPQSTVDLIRQTGTHMFGQGAGKRKQIIS
jgi:hypothetical protein